MRRNWNQIDEPTGSCAVTKANNCRKHQEAFVKLLDCHTVISRDIGVQQFLPNYGLTLKVTRSTENAHWRSCEVTPTPKPSRGKYKEVPCSMATLAQHSSESFSAIHILLSCIFFLVPACRPPAPPPRCNPIKIQGKKRQQLISYLWKMLLSPLPPSPRTASIISHLITPSRSSSSLGLWRPDMRVEIQLNAVPYVFV